MSMTGTFRAISAKQLKAIVADPDSLDEFLEVDDDKQLDVDKSWHGIHFLLTGSAWEGKPPLSLAVLGGTEIGDDNGYGPTRYLTANEVKTVAAALKDITPAQLVQRQTPAQMKAAELYSSDGSRDDMECIREHYGQLRKFYLAAADRGDAVLLDLS